jgi:hypothetical protein
MAYVQSSEDEDQNAANVATNIFQNATGAGQPQGAQTGMPQTSGGDQSMGISGGGASQQPKAPQPSNSASSSKEVIRRNQGKIKSPYDLGEMSTNIAKAQGDLQAEANKYIDTAKTTNRGVADDAIMRAIREGGDPYSTVSTRLTQARPDLDAFKPQTNVDYGSKVKELEDSSLRDYFKRSSGPMGTAGEAAFDTMLLNKNKEFKQERAKVKNEATGLDQKVKEISEKTAKDAGLGYQQAYDTETGRIKDTIRGQIDPIRAQAQARAEETNRARQNILDAQKQGSSQLVKAVGEGAYTDWIRNIANQLGGNTEEDYFLNNYVLNADPTRQNYQDSPISSRAHFVDVNPNMAQAGNFLSGSQADMINRGSNLLGQAGQSYTAMGDPGSAYSFNKGAAEAYLKGELNKMRADKEAQATRAREAEGKANFEKEQQRILAEYEAKKEEARAAEKRYKEAIIHGGATEIAREAKRVANSRRDLENLASGGGSEVIKNAEKLAKDAAKGKISVPSGKDVVDKGKSYVEEKTKVKLPKV